jgi:hypothetical protein
MSQSVRGVFFLVAIVLFAVSAVSHPKLERVNFVALGLALFVIPFCWDAFALS